MFNGIVKKIGDLKMIPKQIRFGTAVGLTKTAQAGQKASQDAIKSTFTVRGNWTNASNKFGIRITPAKRDNLVAQVKTAADWLALHETGGVKTPRGKRLAIPTDNVRRNKKLIIPRAQRPAALRNKRTFVLNTKSGPVLFQRKFKGKRSQLVALYNLEPKAQIKKQSTFYEPIAIAVRKTLDENIRREIVKAMKSAK